MDDEKAIGATVNDYWQGWFEGDAERMERALHPALTKTGVRPDGQTTASMTAADMVGWTREGQGVAERTAESAADITVNEVYDQIATVTVHSGVYREYLHLVKTMDGWRILNALYMRVSDGAAASPADVA